MFGFLKKNQEPADPPPQSPKPSWTERLKAGLARTRAALTTPLGDLFSRAKIDEELLEELADQAREMGDMVEGRLRAEGLW